MQEMYEQREESAQWSHVVIAPNQACLSILYFHVCVKKRGRSAQKENTMMEVWNRLLLWVDASGFHSRVKMNPSFPATHHFPLFPAYFFLLKLMVLKNGYFASGKKIQNTGLPKKNRNPAFVSSRLFQPGCNGKGWQAWLPGHLCSTPGYQQPGAWTSHHPLSTVHLLYTYS